MWKVFGYSIAATRLAMLTAAAAGLLAVFNLAIRLSRGAPGAPAFSAIFFLIASPLFFTQSMMAQLDMPAMGLSALSLLLFLNGRYRAAAFACTALVLTKETGIVIPAVFGLWLLREKDKRAVWFLAPLAVLTLWLWYVASATGVLFGDQRFAGYNLTYPLHPFRFGVAILRRLYVLTIADFHWVGTAAIVAARSQFIGRDWRIVGTVAALHTLEVSILGGAQLERYLLPVLPLFYIAASIAFQNLSKIPRVAGQITLIAGLLLGLFVNPLYPFPFENNLAMKTFVELHQNAAQLVEDNFPQSTIVTAWPLSGALTRPEYGYVQKGMKVHQLYDLKRSSMEPLQDVDVLILYSQEIRRVPFVESWWRRYFGYDDPMTSEECKKRFGLTSVRRWESGGQWVEVLARLPN